MKKPRQIEENSRVIASNARLDPAKSDVPPMIRPKKETSSTSKSASLPATSQSENAPVPIIPGCIDSLVKEVDDLRLHQRLGRIPDVLKTISTSMKHDKCGLLKAEVRNSFKFVKDWVEQSAGQNRELGMYLDYVEDATTYLEVAGTVIRVLCGCHKFKAEHLHCCWCDICRPDSKSSFKSSIPRPVEGYLPYLGIPRNKCLLT